MEQNVEATSQKLALDMPKRKLKKSVYLTYFASQELQKKVKKYAVVALAYWALVLFFAILGNCIINMVNVVNEGLPSFMGMVASILVSVVLNGWILFVGIGLIFQILFLFNKRPGFVVAGMIFQLFGIPSCTETSFGINILLQFISIGFMIWGCCVLGKISKEYKRFLRGEGFTSAKQNQAEIQGNQQTGVVEERHPEDIVRHMAEKKMVFKKRTFLKRFASEKLRKNTMIYAVVACICSVLVIGMIPNMPAWTDVMMEQTITSFNSMNADETVPTGEKIFVTGVSIFGGMLAGLASLFAAFTGMFFAGIGLLFQVLFLFTKRTGFAVTGMVFQGITMMVCGGLSPVGAGFVTLISFGTIIWGACVWAVIQKEYMNFLYRP